MRVLVDLALRGPARTHWQQNLQFAPTGLATNRFRQSPPLRAPKQGKDWLSSMERFALPGLGELPVSDVRSADVVETLWAVWHARPATARRVRQRISTAVERAVALNYGDDYPCSRIGPVLGPLQDLVQHMRVLPKWPVSADV